MPIERSKLNRLLAGFVGAPLAVGAFALSAGIASSASAEELEEVVVTGSRAKPRSVNDSPIPVDVFNQDMIEEVAYTDANEVIKQLVPSFSLGRQPISDGASFIRPASLRDLPTDKTVVLVNNKRRHRSALVLIGGSGTQGPDMATIPLSAVKSIEVLRDGSGAIYGTDAIAGAINFILKDNSEGGSLTVDTGEYSEGDGSSVTVRGNIGLPLGDGGFFSLSGEVYEADTTYRGEQYCQSWWCVEPGLVGNNHTYDPTSGYAAYQAANPEYAANFQNASLEGPVVQPWGQPNIERAGLFFNSEIPLENGRIYAFGNYTTSESDGSFFYRYPGNSVMRDLRQADGSIWNPTDRYPGGFTPRFFGEIEDRSIVAGYAGELSSDLSYDVSVRYGYDEISYTLKNTINPSFGPDLEQRDFRPGDLSNTEVQIQADFAYDLSDTATLAFGLSYLDEEYELVEGEPNSYLPGDYALGDPHNLCDGKGEGAVPTVAGQAAIDGGSTLDCTNESDPVFRAFAVGSNGFPGYSPDFSGTYSRDSYAVYAEITGDASDSFNYQAAIRYEDYSDFDAEVIAKVAGLYRVSDVVAVRASLGTGFRAPTPGQQGTTNVSTRLPNGTPVATGLFPAGSAVAQALGATPLDPETSTQFTVGLVLTSDTFDVTIDAYQINIDDRMNAVSTQSVSTVETDSGYANYLALSAAGVVGAESIGGVNWFTNAFDTSSKGVDIVANMPISYDNAEGSLTFAMNYNKVEFESDPSVFFNTEARFDFLNNTPNTRWYATYNHYMGNLSLMARLSYFGEAENEDWNGSTFVGSQTWDAVTFLDLEASYQVTEQIKVTVGGANITDEYPDVNDLPREECCGRLYDSGNTVDWQGAYYYGRLQFDF